MSSLGPPGPGRTLAFAYAVFAVAAGSRSIAQIASRFSEAPLPYTLSALAAVIYVVAALTVNRPARAGVARVACSVELLGVLVVGLLSVFDAGDFPDQTVWSGFGVGYVFLPLMLPVLGLAWLRQRERRDES